MLWNRYRAVIFDLDGTLIDNSASFRLAYERYCARYPELLRPEDERQRDRLTGIYHAPDRAAAYAAFCREWGWKNPPPFPDFWQEWFGLYVRSAVCFPWTLPTLRGLRHRRIALGLVTNGAARFQNAKIDSAGLRRYFGSVLISGETGAPKPDPSMYRQCAADLGLPVGECLFVGDTPETDIAGARAAGMPSLLVRGKPDSAGATYTSDTISSLLSAVPPLGKTLEGPAS